MKSTNGRSLLIASVLLASMLYTVDSTIANIALPHMQSSLQASQDQIAWVLTSYIVISAIAIPLTGFLGARYGIKRVLVVSIMGFTFFSICCGFAVTLGEMVTFRALQGSMGAALVPLTQVIMLNAYPREKHGHASALWGMGIVVGPIIGPTLGGYLTEYFNWRWVFFVNLPLGLLALFGVLAAVPKDHGDHSRRFDLLGFILLGLAIGLIQLMVDRGQVNDWFESPEIVTDALLGGILLYMFAVHSKSTRHPFFDTRLFRDRNLMLSIAVMFFVGIAIFAPLVLQPPFLQNLQGYPVLDAGWLMAARGTSAFIGMSMVGRLVDRMDSRLILTSGLIIVASTLLMMSRFTLDTPWQTVAMTNFIMGFGMPAMFIPMTVVAFATLPVNLRVEAGALMTLIRNVGTSIGVSAAVAMLTRYAQINQSYMVERLDMFERTRWGLIEQVAGDNSVIAVAAEIGRQAAAVAYANDFYIMALIMFASIPLVMLIKVDRKPDN